MILGKGDHRYEVLEGWGQLPPGWSFKEVAAVAVDSRDQVYVFNRGAHPMIVFDCEGNFLRSWGEGVFTRPHGLTLGPDESLYCTDEGDHTVRKCSLEGKLLLQLGIAGKPSAYQGGEPFNRCTHVALSPQGDIYVSDGYGNSRVHKYRADGRLLLSWGESGSDPGQFNIPHNICADRDGYIYVADRENHRVQVFDPQGRYEAQWNNLHRPCALCMEAGEDSRFFIGELGPVIPINREAPNLGNRVSIVTKKGQPLSRLGDVRGGESPGQFLAPHGIALDSRGDLYVAEVSWTIVGQHLKPPRELRSLQKLRRLPA